MAKSKKEHPAVKAKLHHRNKHRSRYDFPTLVKSSPELAEFVMVNEYGDETVNFFDPLAVKALNKALLKEHYGIDHWDIPEGYLSPPIPGRADYLHHMADLLGETEGKSTKLNIPVGSDVKCLDVGVGSSCIYPILGVKEYGWSFIGSDVDSASLDSSQAIIEANPSLNGLVDLRLQEKHSSIFEGILGENEFVDMVICNPPFHRSAEAAAAVALRKLENLKKKKVVNPVLNFGGQSNELWCPGGQEKFVSDMIFESTEFSTSCFWFSTLISKHAILKGVYSRLKKAKAIEIRTIPMGQGNKSSRIVAWTFLSEKQQKSWKEGRWTKVKSIKTED